MHTQSPSQHRNPPRRSVLTALVAATSLALGALVPALAADDAPAADFAVLVRGTLAAEDTGEAQFAHDAIAAGGEEAARSAGDVYHLGALSTAILGGAEGSFLGLDQWTSPEGIEAFYSDPDIAEAFGSLFAAEPVVELFARRGDWHTWGELPVPSAGDERWIAIVRGRLADADPTVAQAGHDAVAAGAQAGAEQAGDIAHVVFTGLADEAEFLAIDVWERAEGIEAVYGDPAFQEAFATLFEAPPSLTIYGTTDWYQWP